MISPSNRRSPSIRQLALQFEWTAALWITAVVVWLDISYARHAGGLWRDEVNSVSMATYPLMRTIWDRLQFDSFPMLWYVVLRGWVKAGLAQTDAGFRVFGLLVNLAIMAILWLNAWRMSSRPPLVGLTLLCANAAVMMYCGSVRGYGLGLAFGLWMYGAVWAYVVRPMAVRWVLALIAALLACHTLYYNSIFVAAACFAATTVAALRRRWKVAALALAMGGFTALTLLIYIPAFQSSSEWRSMWTSSGGPAWLAFKFIESVTLDRIVMLPIWLMVLVYAVWGGFVIYSRTRNAIPDPAVGQVPPSIQRDGELALFAAISLVVGVIGNILFLHLLSYSMQPWYFLCLMAIIAAGADAAQRAASTAQGFRVASVACASLVLLWVLLSPLRTWSETRRTNLDAVARVVEQSAGKADYVVLTDWTHGVSFNRYYRGTAPWQTLPPLPADAHDIHRSDLVFRLTQRDDAISEVLEAVARTLHGGHRVFYIGHLPKQLPSERPESYLTKRAEQHLAVTPVDRWRYELNYTIRQLSSRAARVHIDVSQPVSSYEDLEVFVFEGWPSSAARGAPK